MTWVNVLAAVGGLLIGAAVGAVVLLLWIAKGWRL